LGLSLGLLGGFRVAARGLGSSGSGRGRGSGRATAAAAPTARPRRSLLSALAFELLGALLLFADPQQALQRREDRERRRVLLRRRRRGRGRGDRSGSRGVDGLAAGRSRRSRRRSRGSGTLLGEDVAPVLG